MKKLSVLLLDLFALAQCALLVFSLWHNDWGTAAFAAVAATILTFAAVVAADGKGRRG